MSNPHYDDAQATLRQANGKRIDECQVLAAVAGAQATLALAYEQRTANLITVLITPSPSIDGSSEEEANEWNRQRDNILTRLGLGETK